MRGRGTLQATLAVVLLALVPLPASAQQIRAAALTVPEFAGSLVSDVRDGTASGVLRALLRAAGLEDPPLVPASRPAGFEEALQQLVGAVSDAEAIRHRATRRLSARDVALVERGLVRSEPTRMEALPSGSYALRSGAPRVVNPRAADIAARVDTDAMRRAALMLLETIERAAPALASGSGEESPSQCGAEGDMLFETSDCGVMVGNSGPNGYPLGPEPVLLVDLGGNDSYENAAAASSSVRVVLDLSGNDSYTRSVASSGPASAFGQAGATLGIAVLADLAGSDSYTLQATANALAPGPAAKEARVVGQGAAQLGAAILLDADGADTYTASATSAGGPAFAAAQGAGLLGGLGALLDLGQGDDVRSAVAESTLHLVSRSVFGEQFTMGPASTVAQGAGVTGVGLLADVSGGEGYAAEARGAAAVVTAQGAGEAGAGVLVDAEGNDSQSARAIGDVTLSIITQDPSLCWSTGASVSTGATRSTAQGGALTGLGTLVDGGGNDVRALEARSFAGAVAESRSNFDCSVFGGNRATASARSGGATTRGQGAGELGAGVLIDLAGGDSNTAAADSKADARAIAISPGPDIETPTATAGTASVSAQGYASTGVGIAADVLGADSYSSAASAEQRTTTSAGTLATVTPGALNVQGWGRGGAGWLLDLDGTDTYASGVQPQSAAANDSCWSNAPDGRGRDLRAGTLPATCP